MQVCELEELGKKLKKAAQDFSEMSDGEISATEFRVYMSAMVCSEDPKLLECFLQTIGVSSEQYEDIKQRCSKFLDDPFAKFRDRYGEKAVELFGDSVLKPMNFDD